MVNRAFKEFGGEHLPFKRFASNAAYYYTMAIAFFLFESFKRDMDSPLVPITWYPTTFRRRCVDIAGKVTRSGGRIVLKITAAAEIGSAGVVRGLFHGESLSLGSSQTSCIQHHPHL